MSPDGPEQRVVTVRHAETEWSLSGRHTGRTDVPLTERGRAIAAQLPQRLAGWTFARVLCSPLSRARETCELAGLGDQAELRDDLMEWDYGDYEGLTTPQIRERRPDWDLWRDGCPGGESPAQIGARVYAVVADLRAHPVDTAVFAHGHVLRVLGACWVDLPTSGGSKLLLSPAGLSVLGYERITPVLARWNDDDLRDCSSLV